jgi:CO/xanthine dehydrogenase FAD-binding subunit
MKEYDYLKPSGLDEALQILSEKEKVKIYAGGTDLIVKLKMETVPDMDYMMDINGIEELKQVEYTDEGVRIGANRKLWDIETDQRMTSLFPALTDAVKAMAAISVRNLASIGGNFCNASPVADAVGPVMCYGGTLEIASARGVRKVPAKDFFLAPGVTVLEKDEMLTGIFIPTPKGDVGHAFTKMARTKSDIAKLSLCVALARDGGRIGHIAMSMGAVAARPLFLEEISAGLAGKEMSESLAMETGEAVSGFLQPIDDNRTTAVYRKDVTKTMVADALALAWARSGGA